MPMTGTTPNAPAAIGAVASDAPTDAAASRQRLSGPSARSTQRVAAVAPQIAATENQAPRLPTAQGSNARTSSAVKANSGPGAGRRCRRRSRADRSARSTARDAGAGKPRNAT